MIVKEVEQGKEIITKVTIERLNSMLGNEQEYLDVMRNLWAIRKGLHTIIEQRSDLREIIAPQFHTLNNLIDALLNFELEHPIYG